MLDTRRSRFVLARLLVPVLLVMLTVFVPSHPLLAAPRPAHRTPLLPKRVQPASHTSLAAVRPSSNVTTIPVGGGPFGVAVDPLIHRAYVTNIFDGSLSVINTTTNRVVTTLNTTTIDPISTDVTVNLFTHVVYATGYSNSVFVIEHNTVVQRILVGNGPARIAVNPWTNRVYVVNQGDNTVSVIDTVANTVIATIPVGAFPLGIAVDPVAHKVYVSGFQDGTVSVIDTTTNLVIATIPVGNADGQPAVFPAIHRAYIPSNDGVAVIDTTTNTVVGTHIPTGSGAAAIAVNKDKRRAYVTNYTANTVSVINTTTNTVVATISGFVGPLGIAVKGEEPDRIYVTNDNNNTVSVITGY